MSTKEASASTTNPAPFLGKKALVVGGTGGIGKAVALGLAGKGATVTIHGGSSEKRLDETLSALRDIAGTGEGFLLPIQDVYSARTILANFAALNQPKQIPDILVCAWGPFKQGSLGNASLEFWQEMVASNLIFPGVLVSLLLNDMIEQSWGRILLFGSTNTDTIRGFATTVPYSAAKTALGVLAKSVAKTATSKGITCNVLCPGLTNTEYTPDTLALYNREKSPGGKPLTPEDIAHTALAILENPAINGTILPVDAGIVL